MQHKEAGEHDGVRGRGEGGVGEAAGFQRHGECHGGEAKDRLGAQRALAAWQARGLARGSRTWMVGVCFPNKKIRPP